MTFRDGTAHSPFPEWPCLGSAICQSKDNAATSRFLFSLSNEKWGNGGKKQVLRLLDVGTVDIPIPSPLEHAASGSMSLPSTSFASAPFSGSVSPAHFAHAAEASARPLKSLSSIRRGWFKKLGFSRGTRKILKYQYTSRTFNQYSGAWSRFSAFVRKEKIPRAEVKESTVLNYLSSRLRNPAKQEKGKVAPLTLRTELYGLLNPLKAEYGLELDPKEGFLL